MIEYTDEELENLDKNVLPIVRDFITMNCMKSRLMYMEAIHQLDGHECKDIVFDKTSKFLIETNHRLNSEFCKAITACSKKEIRIALKLGRRDAEKVMSKVKLDENGNPVPLD